MPRFEHDGLSFHYVDRGSGVPFVFQHGLGGDIAQPTGLFPPPEGVRLISFDCRAHGATSLGQEAKLNIATFADDLVALLDRLDIPQAVVGGISMGAAVALKVALRYPQRVRGLVLSRVAWLDEPHPANLHVYDQIAAHIREQGAERGLQTFQQSAAYRAVLAESPDAAQSLVGQFTQLRAEECVARLERIPHDAPNRDRREWKTIQVPTLVLANRQDPIHPYAYGEELARNIPRAQFQELTPKSVNPAAHVAGVRRFLAEFLRLHFLA